jgi:hypothetical protein
MSTPAPCYRHARTAWMAYCPDCTTWHLAVEVARRDGEGSACDGNSVTASDGHSGSSSATVPASTEVRLAG